MFGVECLKNSYVREYIKKLENKEVKLIVEVERSFMWELNGDCYSFIGVYLEI